jgi:hypothetical protein
MSRTKHLAAEPSYYAPTKDLTQFSPKRIIYTDLTAHQANDRFCQLNQSRDDEGLQVVPILDQPLLRHHEQMVPQMWRQVLQILDESVLCSFDGEITGRFLLYGICQVANAEIVKIQTRCAKYQLPASSAQQERTIGGGFSHHFHALLL